MKTANPFRIMAYRNDADSLRTSKNSLAQIALDKGEENLEGIPNIGEGIAILIYSYVKTGHPEMLER